MIDPPLVSVIIPVYEDAHLVDRAVESVRDQTYPETEVWLIDSSGSKHVQELAAADDIHYVFMPPRGAAAARNRGIEQSNGDLVAFLDADDYWHPEKLEAQVPAIEAGADIVYSDQEVVEL